MPEQRMTTTISDDNSSVAIEFLPASGVTGKLTLNADQLLIVIKAFGDAHAKMILSKPLPKLEGTPIAAVFNTRWYIQPEMMNECSALSFYHPSFGPVAFLIPMEQVKDLVRLLTIQVEMKEAERARPN
jgi:hypothetical protein